MGELSKLVWTKEVERILMESSYPERNGKIYRPVQFTRDQAVTIVRLIRPVVDPLFDRAVAYEQRKNQYFGDQYDEPEGPDFVDASDDG